MRAAVHLTTTRDLPRASLLPPIGLCRDGPASLPTLQLLLSLARRTPVTQQATQALISPLSLTSRSRMSSTLSGSTGFSSLPIGPPS